MTTLKEIQKRIQGMNTVELNRVIEFIMNYCEDAMQSCTGEGYDEAAECLSDAIDTLEQAADKIDKAYELMA